MFIVGFVNKDKGFNGKILIFERKNEENKNRISVRKDRNTGFDNGFSCLVFLHISGKIANIAA